jgi:hypothetical protein
VSAGTKELLRFAPIAIFEYSKVSVLVFAVVLCSHMRAQTPTVATEEKPLSFEVLAIKPSKPDNYNSGLLKLQPEKIQLT